MATIKEYEQPVAASDVMVRGEEGDALASFQDDGPHRLSDHMVEKGFMEWDYVELFKLGDGYAWLYGTWVLLLEILRACKKGGMPGAAQLVLLMKEIEGFPLCGDIFMAIMGKASRPSYKMCGASADQHPAIEDFWVPPGGKGNGCCSACCKCCKCGCCKCSCSCLPCLKGGDDIETPTAPGPALFGDFRATPEFFGITDFDRQILANERTDRTLGDNPNQCCALFEQTFFYASRGFKLRFKTGKGGDTCFNITRRGPSNLYFAFAVLLKILAYLGCTDTCMPSCLRGPQEGCDILGEDDETVIGSVACSDHALCGPHGFFRNRFNAQPKPLYDVLDKDGNVRFQLVVPVAKDKFLRCFTAWYDEDYLTIVRKEAMDALCKEDDWALPEEAGWMVSLRPKFYDTIQQCLADLNDFKVCIGRLTCGLLSSCMDVTMRICLAFVACLRTLPIDDVTQVPNPGTKDLRARTCCSHTISAMRVKLPEGSDDLDRLLLKAAIVFVDFDDALSYL